MEPIRQFKSPFFAIAVRTTHPDISQSARKRKRTLEVLRSTSKLSYVAENRIYFACYPNRVSIAMRSVGRSVWLLPTLELRKNHNAKLSRHGLRVFARMGQQLEPLGMSANSSRRLSALQDCCRAPTEVHTLPASVGGRASVRPFVFYSFYCHPSCLRYVAFTRYVILFIFIRLFILRVVSFLLGIFYRFIAPPKLSRFLRYPSLFCSPREVSVWQGRTCFISP